MFSVSFDSEIRVARRLLRPLSMSLTDVYRLIDEVVSAVRGQRADFVGLLSVGFVVAVAAVAVSVSVGFMAVASGRASAVCLLAFARR